MAKAKRKRKQLPPPPGKKDFLRKLLTLSKISKAESTFYRLPKRDLDAMYNYRLRAVRVVAADDNIPRQLLSEVRNFVDITLNEFKIAVFEDGPEMGLKEFVNVAQPFVLYLTGEIKTCKHGEKFKEEYNELIEFVSKKGILEQKLQRICHILSLFISRINRTMYWMRHTVEHDNGCLFHCFHLHSIQAQKTHAVIDNISRVIYKVGWVFYDMGVCWLSVDSRKFLRKSPYDKLDIYMQSHAFQRLRERLDNDLVHNFIQESLYLSIERMEIEYNCKGRGMIAFYLLEKKVGYLPFDIVENKIVIRTFLFLTMDGTPEGDRVTEQIGIEAKDKEYLQIDRLSAFLASDITQNEEIYNIFINAGCGSLFKLPLEEYCEETKSVSTIKAYLHRAVA